MVTYAIVLLVVVAVLYASFRALAIGGPVAPEDHRAVLVRLCELTGARERELAAALAAPATAALAARASERPADPLVAAAAAARKHLGGYHQQLTGALADGDGAGHEALEPARTLLVAAVEDLAWACRLVEGGGHAGNPGIRAAVRELGEHGGRCLRAAAALLGGGPDTPPPAGGPE